MADEEQAPIQNENKGTLVAPQKVYLKDVSFEAPNSPEIFREEWNPSISMEVESASKYLDNDFHEVILTLTVTVSFGEKVAYLAEVHQGGLFVLKGLSPQDLDKTLNVFCMKFLYNYASSTLLDLVSKGDFPQIFLPPMEFGKRYQQRMLGKEAAEAAEKTKESEA